MANNLVFVGKYKVEGLSQYGTIQSAVTYLKRFKELGLDIETSKHPILGEKETDIYRGGLDPYLSRVIMLQIGTAKRQYAIDMRDYSNEELQPLIDLLHWNANIKFIGHNLKFEGKHLRHNYGIRLLEVYDTMLAELCLFNGVTEGLTLADLAEKYLGITKKVTQFSMFDFKGRAITLEDSKLLNPDLEDKVTSPFEVELDLEIDKSIRLQFIKLTNEPFTLEQLVYGIGDVTLPLEIKAHQDKGHKLLGFWFHNADNIRLESLYTQVGADMELNGLPFSQEIWKSYHEKNEIKYIERLKLLNNYVISFIPKFTAMTLFGEGHEECMVDWKSPKQVVALFRHLKACPMEKSKQTKQLEYSVSSKAMLPTLDNNYKDDYGRDVDRAIVDTPTLKLAYLLLKKSQMNITTYGNDFLKYVHPITGRLHPNYRLHLISSRTATTSPNLLAIPGSHRGAFTTKGTGRVLVVNDYSSQESRNIASLSEDKLLLDFFNKGHELYGSDFHSYTSGMVHEVRNPESKLVIVPKEYPDGTKHPDFTPEMAKMRQDIKSVNFGLAYGITAMSLSKQLGISMDEAFDLVEGYFETFADLHKFIEGSKAQAIHNGFVLFEPKTKAIFIQRDFAQTQARAEECKSYFFNDHYKELDPDARAKYKAELYRDMPHIKTWFSEVGMMHSRLGNRGCNLKIQGVSAKQSKVAQLNIRKYEVTHPNITWKMCLLLHDEIVSETAEEYGQEVFELQGKFMNKAASFFCPNVKFETAGEVGEEWKH